MLKLNKYSFAYLYVRLVRQAGEPDYIARGVAIGLLTGLIIPFGFQIPVAIALAFVFKAAKIPAFACTWVTNHFTIFIIYPVQCWVGSYLIGNPLHFIKVEKQLEAVIAEPAWTTFKSLGAQFVASFFAGGILFGILLAVPGYFVTLLLVKKYRKLKELKLKRRRRKLQTVEKAS
ncbi:MAG: DUF2062 domain-containing protein [Victivallales bacterium]|nr:DUF2062 domain-containing protein [Victivallales bacterium]